MHRGPLDMIIEGRGVYKVNTINGFPSLPFIDILYIYGGFLAATILWWIKEIISANPANITQLLASYTVH